MNFEARRVWCKHLLFAWQVEEFLGHGKSVLHSMGAHGMIDDVDEADTAAGLDQLYGYGLFFIKVCAFVPCGEVNNGYGRGFRHDENARKGFQDSLCALL